MTRTSDTALIVSVSKWLEEAVWLYHRRNIDKYAVSSIDSALTSAAHAADKISDIHISMRAFKLITKLETLLLAN